jgi:MFS family permease
LFYQDGRGLSALGAGLSTFPEAIGVMLGSQLASRLIYPRLGPRRHILVGTLGMATSLTLLTLIGAQTNLWWSRMLLFGIGLSLAQIMIPIQAATFATITPAETAQASTLFNAIRQFGGAIGVAGFTSVIVAVGPQHVVQRHVVPNLSAYHDAFLAAAGFALISGISALRIVDSEAAATIVRRRTVKHSNPGSIRQPV